MRVSLRPDPSKGVFETMLVVAGRPLELEAHLARLEASLASLYSTPLPSEAAAAARGAARDLDPGRLRLTARPGSEGPQLRLQAEAIDPTSVFPGPERGVSLRSLTVPGGLGAHKWADRRLLRRAALGAAGELALLVDADGSVLEAARASVFAIRGGALATPPADGRILPSIARRRVIEVARSVGIEVHEERLGLADLAAGELFVAGSVRGIEPVLAVDGAASPLAGELSARVAAGLRDRWLTTPAGEPVAAVAGGRPAGRPGR